MIKGITLAMLACLLWGLIFVVPGFVPGFSAIEVALGRHCVYGLVSCLMFIPVFRRYPLSVWRKAGLLSIFSTVGYYTCLVLSMRYASPAVCALIIGMSPITVALYGNLSQKEVSFKFLLLPSFLMVVGLVLVNIPYIEASNNPSLYGFGICCALFSLISWTWFAIESVKFLKTNPEVDSTSWSTLIGMATLVWVLLAYLILYLGFPETLHTDRYFTAHPEFLSLLGSSAVLGIICSWVGSAFWNKACLHIPISLAGQLLIFETLFGLAYVYLLASTYPVPIEFLGILFLLGGVTLGVMRFSKLKRVDSAP